MRRLKGEDRLEIAVAEVLSDSEHALDTELGLEKEGIERELQELLADARDGAARGSGSCVASGRPTSARSI